MGAVRHGVHEQGNFLQIARCVLRCRRKLYRYGQQLVSGDQDHHIVLRRDWCVVAKTRAQKSSLVNGPSSVASEINSSSQPRSGNLIDLHDVGTHSITTVHHEFRTRERQHPTKGVVHREQSQIDAYQLGGELEKPQDFVCRYFLCPLVGLGDLHRRSDERPPHARSARKSALPGTCRIVLDVFELSPLLQLSRAFLIPPRGSCPKQTSTLVIMERHRSSFIKVSGTSWTALSSETLSPCAKLMVRSDLKLVWYDRSL